MVETERAIPTIVLSNEGGAWSTDSVRGLGFIVMLCASVGCYDGPPDPAGEPTDSGATGGSGSPSTPSRPSDPTAMSGLGDTSGSNDSMDSMDSDDPSDPTTAGTSTTDPGDSDDTTSGAMSGCEGGPLPAPIPGCAPAPPPSTGDIHQDCVDRINQLRWECQCLPPLERWSDAEVCSDDQSSADQNGGGAHGNFGMCNENAQNTCPNWGSEAQVIGGCLQAMWDEGPGEPFSEHGHYINMSSTNYSRVACGFASGNGGVWSNQNFRP